MGNLEKLFKKCKSIAEIGSLLHKTHFFKHALEYAVNRLDELQKEATRKGQPLLPDVENLYSLKETKRQHLRKFGVWERDVELKLNSLPFIGIELVLPVLLEILQSVFEQLSEGSRENDLIRIVLQSAQIDRPISLKTTRKADFNLEMFFNELVKVLNSHQEFRLDKPIQINVKRIAAGPKIGGRNRRMKNEVLLERVMRMKRCGISITADGLCFSRALVVGKALADGKNRSDRKYWEALRRGSRSGLQYQEACNLHRSAGIELGPVQASQFELFQEALPDYQITIYNSPIQQSIIFSGSPREKQINLFLHKNHFAVITRLAPFFGKRRHCKDCGRYVDKLGRHHRCTSKCFVCLRQSCRFEESRYCSACNSNFKNDVCYQQHLTRTIDKKIGKTICQSYFVCQNCEMHVNMQRSREGETHVCYETFCPNCKKLVPPSHKCHIKIYTNAPKPMKKFLFCDFECSINEEHSPIAAVAVEANGVPHFFLGADTKQVFCRWLFHPDRRGSLALFHNLSYDGSFILQFLQENNVKPEILTRGLRILQIHVRKFDLTIKDSYAFLPMSLASMPKAFDLPSGPKGCFPFLFCHAANIDYIGKIPEEKFFFTHSMSEKVYKDFASWYAERSQSDEPWEFRKEILKYCEQDCQILRLACLNFSKNMRDLTGFCPFIECVTLPAFVNLVFRARYMPEKSIALLGEDSSRYLREVSHESLEWLEYVQLTEGITMKHGFNGGEEKIGKFRVDGFCQETKTVYEYNGCLFHGCPTCYDEESMNYEGNKMKDLFARTRRKQQFLELRGFRYIEMWSCQWCKLKETDNNVKEFLKTFTMVPPMDVRSALFGGRCEPFILKRTAKENEKITYKDITILYPAVCSQESFPVSHPTIIRENFSELETYFGLAYVTCVPPRGLRLPVLPVRVKTKTFFTLCAACAVNNVQGICQHTEAERHITGVYTTEELKLALSVGYRIIKLHEVWHFPERSDVIFRKMIQDFYILKVTNSGWPEVDMTPESKQAYLQQLYDDEGLTLRERDIRDNPAMRLLAKLILNSLWGRFALKPNRAKFEYVNDVARFQELVFSGHHHISWMSFVNDDTVQIHHQETEDVAAFDPSGSIVIASFVTSYARIRLYHAMSFVGPERLLYVDTDCVVAVEESGFKGLPTGSALGQFKDELTNGSHIVHWCCGAPKTYCYLTSDQKVVFKHEGIPINFSNRATFTMDTLERMVSDHSYVESVIDPYRIFRIKGSWKIISKNSSKIFRFTFDKRQIIDSFYTLPHGYSGV